MRLHNPDIPADISAMGNPPYGRPWQEWITWLDDMPLARQLGLRCESIDDGRATFVLDASDWLLNPFGAVHGGIVLACADHCFGGVATTVLRSGQVPVTATLTCDFLRPAISPIRFDATVERSGRTLAFVSVAVRDRQGLTTNQARGTMSVAEAPINGSGRP